jgi:hypothetical protein
MEKPEHAHPLLEIFHRGSLTNAKKKITQQVLAS